MTRRSTSQGLLRLAHPLRVMAARPRLALSVAVGIATASCLPLDMALHSVTRAIVGWNAGALLYLALAMHLMFWSTPEKLRSRAVHQDLGSVAVLALVMVSALMCLAAIVFELGVVKDLYGELKFARIGLAAMTIFTSWSFTQVMFALHYAHDYYLNDMRGLAVGLEFPGGQAPDYGDFLYFAVVIGTSGQTADVSFSSRAMRRTGLLHCALAYFFNTTVLALTINIASGLI